MMVKLRVFVRGRKIEETNTILERWRSVIFRQGRKDRKNMKVQP
jgi:hypothetical protein